MSATEFHDTNVLVYRYDVTDARKHKVAKGLVRRALAGHCVTSTQVLGEFASTLLHKFAPRLAPGDLAAILDVLHPLSIVAVDVGMVRRAVDVRAEYGLHFYDALIVAAAERAECSRIWSEDLSSGQQYFGITVQNPF